MTDTQRKWLAVAAGLAALALIASQFLFGASPIPSAAPSVASSPATSSGTTSTQPKITWSTTSISLVLPPGENTSNNLTFTSSQKLTNVSLSVVPQIAPFVTVQPSSISSLPANQGQAVQLSFVIPPSATLGTYGGTLQLKSGTTTFPQTVKITLNVWRLLPITNSNMSMLYPPDWVVWRVMPPARK